MKSAHLEAFGKEPETTLLTDKLRKTVDYIWYDIIVYIYFSISASYTTCDSSR